MQTAATSEKRHVPKSALHDRMVHIVVGVSWGELCSEGILDGKPVLFSFEEGGFREPVRSEDLELVRVLARLQNLALGELHDDLLHRDDFFHLAMVVFDRYHIFCVEMAAFHSAELNHQVGRVKGSADLNVDGARNGLASHVAQLVVVEVDVDGAVAVDLQTLVPEHARVPLVAH